MGPEGFRRLATGLSGAEERQHMHHPDFRVGGRVFATMGYPDEQFAMVKLTPEQQKEMIAAYPEVFAAVKGKWGEQGCTHIRLRPATKELVKPALEMAFRNAAVKKARR